MGLLVWLGVVIFFWLLANLPRIIRFFFRNFCRIGIATFVTPDGHLKYGDFEDSEGYNSLSKEGYDVESLWPSDSVAKLNNG